MKALLWSGMGEPDGLRSIGTQFMDHIPGEGLTFHGDLTFHLIFQLNPQVFTVVNKSFSFRFSL